VTRLLPNCVKTDKSDEPVKLTIQIPCFNEEHSLAAAIAALPKDIPGIKEIEVQVIDDGSEDSTAEIALACGAIVHSLGRHRGLAEAFSAGLRAAVSRGADIIVNTDADNQYDAADIPSLIQPILAEQADFVLGDRDVATEEFFSPAKRALQKIGSAVVSLAVGAKVPDATSGFRAFSRAAASRVLVLSKYSYTLETLIQAGALKERIAFVPVRTNAPVRPSRLMRSKFEYVRRSAFIILRSYTVYHPIKTVSISTGILCGSALAGFALDVNSLIFTAGVLESFVLAGFGPMYQAHRSVLRRVVQQSNKLEQTSGFKYAKAPTG
jgi:glycosyltransferase involved in cell wall biosynthesis